MLHGRTLRVRESEERKNTFCNAGMPTPRPAASPDVANQHHSGQQALGDHWTTCAGHAPHLMTAAGLRVERTQPSNAEEEEEEEEEKEEERKRRRKKKKKKRKKSGWTTGLRQVRRS